jgi:hypothetical protein
MEVYTELVPFHDLPQEAQRRPTETLTWARQTPEYLYLETIVPPQCKVCLARLEEMNTGTAQLPMPDPLLVEDTMLVDEGDMFSDSVENFTEGLEMRDEEDFPDRRNVSNLPTPAMLIPGRYLWAT